MGRPISAAIEVYGSVRILRRGNRYRIQWSKGGGGERSATTIQRAREIAHAISAKIDIDGALQPNLTVGALASRWLENAPENWSEKHFEKMHQSVKNHIIPQIGHKIAANMRPADWQDVLDDLAGEGYSSSLIDGVWQAMKGTVQRGQLSQIWGPNGNPLIAVKKPKPSQDPFEAVDAEQVPTAAQVETLWKAMTKPRDRLLVRLAAGSGLRWAELMGLRRADIDLTARTIRVTRQVVETSGKGLIERAPKTKRGVRSAPIPKSVVQDLREHIADLDDDDWVFRADRGGFLRRSNWGRRIWRPAHTAAGWPAELTFHSLRHFAATDMLRKGVDAVDVSRMLGHSNVRFTLARYVGADADYVQRALKVL